MRVRIKSEGAELEGILEGGGDRGLVLCHPHPLYGGDMHNSVVAAIARKAAKRGYSALRINYRGVGGSTGSYSGGEGETIDCLSAARFLQEREADRIFFAGYSFGSYVGLRAAVKLGSVGAGISPPTVAFDFSFLKESRVPVLLLVGGKDEFVDVELLRGLGAKILVAGNADHFWAGLESWVADRVLDFFDEH